ncbi:MAG: hypothetical protein AB8G18_16140 [Gammaproteobacteria bacterium]
MAYAFSLAVIICGITLTGLRAVINMTSTTQFHFDMRVLLLLVAGGLLLRHQWARLTAMVLSAFACLSIFYVGVRGTLNANQLHIQALWYESTNASVVALWLICGAMIGYFMWSCFLLSSKRTRAYFAK